MSGRTFWQAILFATGLLAFACEDTGYMPLHGREWAVYRLEDTTLTSSNVWGEPLQNLSLQSTPLFTASDLKSYRWASHAMEGTPHLDSLLDRMAHSQGSVFGRPFVVKVGNDRIYLGSFWWAYSSLMPQCPYIELISPKPWRIELPPMHAGDDPRADARVYQSLKDAGVLVE